MVLRGALLRSLRPAQALPEKRPQPKWPSGHRQRDSRLALSLQARHFGILLGLELPILLIHPRLTVLDRGDHLLDPENKT